MESRNNSIGELLRARLSAQISGDGLTFGNGLLLDEQSHYDEELNRCSRPTYTEGCLFDFLRMFVKVHVSDLQVSARVQSRASSNNGPQHHQGRKKERSGVSEALACDNCEYPP